MQMQAYVNKFSYLPLLFHREYAYYSEERWDFNADEA